MKNYLVLILLTFFYSHSYSQVGWAQVNSFGSNPGDLLMYRYVPANIPSNAALVVVLHGCTQTAANYDLYSGWDTLSNHHKFYVVHAEQAFLNNFNLCFNWFLSSNNSKDQGEALSVKQMVDYMKNQYSIDDSKVFVTGLSAGGCLTNVMLAAYPEVFSAGAIMAGTPYKSATDAISASYAMSGYIIKTPAEWGDLVRNENPSFSGTYPKIAVFHGSSDLTVSATNVTEIIKQWTNVHGADQTADLVNSSFNGNANVLMKQYRNTSGNTVVQTYVVSSMAHGIAVDPGTCFQQGGTYGFNSYSYDKDFYSSFWAAEFFGLIQNPYPISGSISVNYSQNNLVYSVPFHSGSSYYWNFPSGVTILSGQGTNQVTVQWGTASGFITVNETSANACIVGPTELYVTAQMPVGMEEADIHSSEFNVFSNETDNSLTIKSSFKKYDAQVFDQTGRLLLTVNHLSNNAHIDLPNNIQTGLYIIQITTLDKTLSRKFLKM